MTDSPDSTSIPDGLLPVTQADVELREKLAKAKSSWESLIIDFGDYIHADEEKVAAWAINYAAGLIRVGETLLDRISTQAPNDAVAVWSPQARAVMDVMGDGEIVYPAGMVAADASAESGLDISEKQTRAIMRALHTLGLADYGPLYDDDSSYIKGRGYWLSSKGRKLLAALAKFEPVETLK